MWYKSGAGGLNIFATPTRGSRLALDFQRLFPETKKDWRRNATSRRYYNQQARDSFRPGK
jgi:hypothetical protein